MQKDHPCTGCFNTLGVESRMKIYSFLRKVSKGTVGEVVKEVKLTQPTVSYHLKEMKENGLLSSTKKGKMVYYSINERCPSFDEKCVLSKVVFPKEK